MTTEAIDRIEKLEQQLLQVRAHANDLADPLREARSLLVRNSVEDFGSLDDIRKALHPPSESGEFALF